MRSTPPAAGTTSRSEDAPNAPEVRTTMRERRWNLLPQSQCHTDTGGVVRRVDEHRRRSAACGVEGRLGQFGGSEVGCYSHQLTSRGDRRVACRQLLGPVCGARVHQCQPWTRTTRWCTLGRSRGGPPRPDHEIGDVGDDPVAPDQNHMGRKVAFPQQGVGQFVQQHHRRGPMQVDECGDHAVAAALERAVLEESRELVVIDVDEATRSRPAPRLAVPQPDRHGGDVGVEAVVAAHGQEVAGAAERSVSQHRRVGGLALQHGDTPPRDMPWHDPRRVPDR